MLVLIILGLVFQIRSFLTGRSLWLDEAMLALNILNRSFGGLFQQPMDYGQSSPIGYVLSVKAVTVLLGDSEYALRLYSLIAGSLVLILFPVVSRNVLGKAGTLVALAVLAFNPDLIYYASETKQYSSDVIVTLLFLVLLHRQLSVQATRRDFVLLGIAGAFILWFSHPVAFVAAGTGIVLFLHYWRRKDRERLLATTLCGLGWGASLIILYIVNLRHLASSELLLNYWQEGFMEADLGWFMNTWQAFLDTPIGTGANPVLIFALFVVGLWVLIRNNWEIGTTIILTMTFALVASGFHKYSLLGRMLLFFVPFYAMAVGAGLEGIGSLFKKRYSAYAIQILAAVYLLWAPLGGSIDEFINPKYREHIKPTLAYLRDSIREHDLIYVYYNTGPAFRYYAPKFRLDGTDYIIGNDHSANPQEYQDELDGLMGNKRVWLIFSHIYEKDDFNEKEYILAYADQIGEEIREYRVPSTSIYLYLYDFQ